MNRRSIRILLLLESGTNRLVTLMGPGGIGKTRLAIQIAQILTDQKPHTFADGIYFVALTALQEWQMIGYAIAHALGLSLPPNGRDSAQQLFEYVRHKQLLLILDNFEHIIGPESNQLILDLLGQTPHLRIMVTSRSQLNIFGEQIYPLGGLDMPDLADVQQQLDLQTAVQKYGALQLFNQFARQLRPEFQLNQSSLDAMMRICRAVGGMPLAIELAASWIEVLRVEEIATQVERSLELLTTDAHGVPERQRSLRAVCDYSWRFLTDSERVAMQQMSVFHGGFDRSAAEVVVGIEIKTLLALVNKSWLRRGSNNRFDVHELLRQYCAESLAQNLSAEEVTRERHADYYCNWLSQRYPDLKGASQRPTLDAIAADLANILDGCSWAAFHNRSDWLAQAATVLGQFFRLSGDIQGGVRFLAKLVETLTVEDAQAQGVPALVNRQLALARLLTQLSVLTSEIADTEVSDHYIEQALTGLNSPILAVVDTRQEHAQLACELGYNNYISQPALAIEHFAESYRLYQNPE